MATLASPNFNLDVMKLLLDRGGDPNAKMNQDGRTSLHIAAEKGNVEAIRMLVANGAELEATTNVSYTPFCVAVSSKKHEAVKELAKLGANVDHQDLRGATPLLFTILSDGDASMVRTLLEAGVNKDTPLTPEGVVMAEGSKGNSYEPIAVAVQNGHWEIVRDLIKAGAKIPDNPANTSLLGVAATQGSPKTIRELVNAGQSVSQESDDKGNSPLHFAAFAGKLEATKELVALGADINAKNHMQDSPLFSASIGGRVELIEYLVSLGVDANQLSNEATPLAGAVYNNRVAATKKLLELGADPNAPVAEDKIPLSRAVTSGNDEIITELLRYGANPNVKSVRSWMPIHIAAHLGNTLAIRALVKAGAELDPALDDSYGYTPMMVAMDAKKWDAARELIDLGANVNVVSKTGLTPLMSASVGAGPDLVKALLDGVDLFCEEVINNI